MRAPFSVPARALSYVVLGFFFFALWYVVLGIFSEKPESLCWVCKTRYEKLGMIYIYIHAHTHIKREREIARERARARARERERETARGQSVVDKCSNSLEVHRCIVVILEPSKVSKQVK